ncbi:MAG TPA: laminin B domain-containing protein [Pyrinomonadaceae bacterium]|nr:laminin B domain-containing protein [Pyrinomonadaceae bacterium]
MLDFLDRASRVFTFLTGAVALLLLLAGLLLGDEGKRGQLIAIGVTAGLVILLTVVGADKTRKSIFDASGKPRRTRFPLWATVSVAIILIVWLIITSILLGLSPSTPTRTLAISTFDHSDEGWQVVNNEGNGPLHFVSGGNPDGYISAEDAKEASPWYWSAPAKFLGDKSVAYGGELIFDLRQSRIDNPGQTTIDVILSGGGITLDFDESYNPGTQWTRYTIRLDVSAEWKITGSNQAATRADLARVLKSLEELKILGDYRVGKGNCDLDNVMLIGR